MQKLRNAGFMAEIIGQTNNGNDRLLYSGGSARYLERPAEDEIYRILKKICIMDYNFATVKDIEILR